MSKYTITKKKKIKINLKRMLSCVGVIVVAVFVFTSFLDVQGDMNDNRQQIRNIEARIAEANLQTIMLEEVLSKVETDEFLERVARESLRMARPGDRIFVDSSRN